MLAEHAPISMIDINRYFITSPQVFFSLLIHYDAPAMPQVHKQPATHD